MMRRRRWRMRPGLPGLILFAEEGFVPEGAEVGSIYGDAWSGRKREG